MNPVLIHPWTKIVIVESTRFSYFESKCDIVITGFLSEGERLN